MRLLISTICILFFNSLSFSQIGLRTMYDVPAIYLVSNDLFHLPKEDGFALQLGYGIGTHHVMAKVSAGFTYTLDFSHIDEPGVTNFFNPFIKFEIGGGNWRTNSDQLYEFDRYAYTILPKFGLTYNFGKKDANKAFDFTAKVPSFDYYAALELSLFQVQDDPKKNGEFFVAPGYNFKTKKFLMELGIKKFLISKNSK